MAASTTPSLMRRRSEGFTPRGFVLCADFTVHLFPFRPSRAILARTFNKDSIVKKGSDGGDTLPTARRAQSPSGPGALGASMKTRAMMISSVLAAGALVLAGCSGGDSEEGTGTVTYWSQWEQNEPQAEVLQDAIEDFTDETGIEVKVEWQGRQVMQKLQPLLRSGDVPDVVDASSNDIRATLVRAGQARDLGDLFATQVPGEDTA